MDSARRNSLCAKCLTRPAGCVIVEHLNRRGLFRFCEASEAKWDCPLSEPVHRKTAVSKREAAVWHRRSMWQSIWGPPVGGT
jgi:hypothetical protein